MCILVNTATGFMVLVGALNIRLSITDQLFQQLLLDYHQLTAWFNELCF